MVRVGFVMTLEVSSSLPSESDLRFFSVLKLPNNLFFYVEFKTSTVALVLRLAVLLSPLFNSGYFIL